MLAHGEPDRTGDGAEVTEVRPRRPATQPGEACESRDPPRDHRVARAAIRDEDAPPRGRRLCGVRRPFHAAKRAVPSSDAMVDQCGR